MKENGNRDRKGHVKKTGNTQMNDEHPTPGPTGEGCPSLYFSTTSGGSRDFGIKPRQVGWRIEEDRRKSEQKKQ